MARPRVVENGTRSFGFSIDDETLERLEALAKELGLHSKSAALRYAVKKVYRIEILGIKD